MPASHHGPGLTENEAEYANEEQTLQSGALHGFTANLLNYFQIMLRFTTIYSERYRLCRFVLMIYRQAWRANMRQNERIDWCIQDPPLHFVAPHDGLFEYANTNIIIQNIASCYARSRQKLGENNRGINFFSLAWRENFSSKACGLISMSCLILISTPQNFADFLNW